MNCAELTERSEERIRQALRHHLPPGTRVFLFGSRARGKARWNSDYDLWVDAEVSRRLLGRICDEIDEPFVPFSVDLVATPLLDGDFERQVRSQAVPWV